LCLCERQRRYRLSLQDCYDEIISTLIQLEAEGLVFVCYTFLVNGIESAICPEKVNERELAKLREEQLNDREMIPIDSNEWNHAMVSGTYMKQKKQPVFRPLKAMNN
jgi:hypothetical protein